MLRQKRLDVAIKLMRSIEQSLEYLHSKILANLKNVGVFADHLSKYGQISASGRVSFQVVLEYEIISDLLLDVGLVLRSSVLTLLDLLVLACRLLDSG